MNHIRTALVAGLLAAAVSAPLSAELTLPAVFSDHMVLQRDLPAPVWGRATPGATVTVSFGGRTVRTTTDAGGAWSATLDPMPASAASRTLTIEGDGARVAITDVLVGEVWVCGGQSNMEWTINGANDPAGEKARANKPQIRLIKAPHVTATSPAETIDAAWTVCSPESVGNFTAVGYTFGQSLHDALDVPIGLLSINWGGTRIEPWISGPSLASAPVSRDNWADLQARVREAGGRTAEEVAARNAERMAAYEAAAEQYMQRQMDASPDGGATWMTPSFDDTAWGTVDLPTAWKDTDDALAGFDGSVWYRRTVDVPADWAGRPLLLELCGFDDSDVTWWNGERVGITVEQWNQGRRYRIDPALVKAGRAVITIMNVDGGGLGGPNGAAAAMKLSVIDRKATTTPSLPLAGTWRWRQGGPHRGARMSGPPAPEDRPGVKRTDYAALYNGMLAAFVPYGVRGAIWYQGESNAGEPERYRAFMPLLIEDWRTAFRRDRFPFGIVQLAAFRAPAPYTPAQDGWPALRDAQRFAARTVPDAGLVITTDIGDAKDIHPRNKRTVGERLARWALSTVYDHDGILYTGPRCVKTDPVRLEDGSRGLRLTFSNVGAGLRTRDGSAPGGFGIRSEGGAFVWADARIEGRNTVVVSSPSVIEPFAACFAWQDNPVNANLTDSDGLPAGPFRTDRLDVSE